MSPGDYPSPFGKYQLLEHLARGGMADVFRAKSRGVEGFEKVLVIKRILAELATDESFVEMFVNEAKIAVTLSHANIVQVFDLGRIDDAYYIAMEHVAGIDLERIHALTLANGHPMPVELAVFLASEIAKALDYAHRRRDSSMKPLGIVHRDVSPSNVLVSFEGEVKLTDFGIAKALHTGKTDEGLLKGKIAYMAPEQARAESVDARADLFSLGVVLYELLSGTHPFRGETSRETYENVLRASPAPLTHVPPELARIVEVALRADPDDRYPTAGLFYEDLIQFLYSAGRRVSAMDLGAFLAELRDASPDPTSLVALPESSASSLRAAFESESLPATDPDTDQISISDPPNNATRRPRLRNSSGFPTPSRASAEKRDVAFIAFRYPAELGDTARSGVANLIASLGGTLLDEGLPESEGFAQAAAVFGASHPDGRENEAAAHCAIRIYRLLRRQVPLGDDVRVVVHSGRAYVDSRGVPLFDERYLLLLGEIAGLLDAAGEGEGPSASTSVVASLKSRFVVSAESAGGVIAAHLLDARPATETYGRFLGRKSELRTIGEILAFASRQRLRVVSLTGEPGIGKTRLVHEIARRLELGKHDVGVYVASCTPHTRSTPFSAIDAMLRAVIGATDLDDREELRIRVQRLRELGLGTTELDAVSSLFGLRDAPNAELAEGLRSALLRAAVKLAEDKLSLFVWDGVESIDNASMELLDQLFRRAVEARIVVLMSGRNASSISRWGGGQGPHHSVVLPPLSDAEIDALTMTRLDTSDVPPDLLREIRERSGGNPFYAEEFVEALLAAGAIRHDDDGVAYDSSVVEVGVPKSLRGLVASRIARLAPLQRSILHAMAFAEARVPAELVAKVVGAELLDVGSAMHALASENLIVDVGRSEYDFAHQLVADVLREGLDIDARKRIHRALATGIELLFAGRGDEFADRLAVHWREAGERVRAIDALERAARRFEAKLEFASAISALARAIAMLGQLASPDRDRMLALYRRIGELGTRGRVVDEGSRLLREGIELADGLGRDEYVARFCVLEGRLLASSGQVDEARRWIDRGRELSRIRMDLDLTREAALASAECDARTGQNHRALEALREALEISRELGDVAAQMRCLIPLALAFGQEGETSAGLDALQKAHELVGDDPDRLTECELLKMESLVYYYARDYAGCIDRCSRALALAKEHGLDYEIAVNAHNLGETYIRVGDFRRAFSALQQSHEMCRERGYVRIQMMNQRALAFVDAHRFRDDAQRAGSADPRERIVEALRFADERGYLWDSLQAQYMLALVDSLLGHVDSARKNLREVLRTAADNGHRRYVLDAEYALAALDKGEPIPLPA